MLPLVRFATLLLAAAYAAAIAAYEAALKLIPGGDSQCASASRRESCCRRTSIRARCTRSRSQANGPISSIRTTRRAARARIFEPPGSTHTLKVADENNGDTDVVFIVYGAMIHLGPQGEVLAVGDAESHLRDWPTALRAQGKPVPKTLPIGGAMRYRAMPG